MFQKNKITFLALIMFFCGVLAQESIKNDQIIEFDKDHLLKEHLDRAYEDALDEIESRERSIVDFLLITARRGHRLKTQYLNKPNELVEVSVKFEDAFKKCLDHKNYTCSVQCINEVYDNFLQIIDEKQKP